MSRLVLVGAVAALMFFAGCIEEGGFSKSASKRSLGGAKEALAVVEGMLPVTEPLWQNPQYYPHPAYNYPTLTNPPQIISNPWLKPIQSKELPTNIQGLNKVGQVDNPAARSSGMSVIGSLAILPSSVTRLVDISDPTAPKVVGEFNVSARASDVIVYPDGTIVAVLASGRAIVLADITDPVNPSEISRIQTLGTHKVDVVPGTPIIYNSANGEIFDASDPANPVNSTSKMPATCHRTYFYNDPVREMYRAYCAGYEFTHIWDTVEPLHPKLIKSIKMWHANDDLPNPDTTPVTFSHFSIPNDDASVLIVGDEMGGGAAPACGVHASTPVRDASTPTGALWFYDIKDEKNPTLLSWISPRSHVVDNPGAGSCTAHHGRIVPDPTRDLLAMGFYNAGVILVDFTDPSSPQIIDQQATGMKVWEAIYYNGYVFTGDMGHGLDTLGFE